MLSMFSMLSMLSVPGDVEYVSMLSMLSVQVSVVLTRMATWYTYIEGPETDLAGWYTHRGACCNDFHGNVV